MRGFRFIPALMLAVVCSCNTHKPLDLPDPDSGEATEFRIHAEISTDKKAECAVLSLCLTEGDKSCSYTGKVYVDGEPMNANGFRINFSDTPIHTVLLPATLLPGEHAVKVEVHAWEHTETVDLTFKEPIRHPELWIQIGHDDKSGCTYLSVDENPYGLKFTVTDHITVNGKCTYSYCDYSGHVDSKTVTKVIEDDMYLPVFEPKAGVQYKLINRKAKEDEMTSFGMDNYRWKQIWVNESEGYWDYVEEYAGRTFFQVTSAVQDIDVRIDGVKGITVKVYCSEKEIRYNGIMMGSGSYSYTI